MRFNFIHDNYEIQRKSLEAPSCLHCIYSTEIFLELFSYIVRGTSSWLGLLLSADFAAAPADLADSRADRVAQATQPAAAAATAPVVPGGSESPAAWPGGQSRLGTCNLQRGKRFRNPF